VFMGDTVELRELSTQRTFKISTVGALKEALNDLPDDIEIDICSTGKTGFIDGDVELEINTWADAKPYVCLNICAESGYAW